jgi:iron complex outermembrane recepter protein
MRKSPHIKEFPRVTISLLAGLAAAALVPGLALAQDTNATAMKPVVVTGSLIPTFETITPTPVSVYNAEDIAKTGMATFSDLSRAFPFVSGTANFGSGEGNGGDGTGGINLRGIFGGTLVLIDGRRVAPNELNGRGNVDINAIPIAAIDHIEVLKDGASAVYGADAVAGVVNVILKKNFTGTEFFGRYGNSDSGDPAEKTFSFVTASANEKASLLIGGSFYETDALKSDDRDVSRVDINNPLDFAFGTSRTPNPGRVGATKANNGQPGFPPSGLIYTGPVGTTPTSTNQFRTVNDATDRAIFSHFTYEVTPMTRWYAFGNGSYNLLDNNALQFFAEASYAHTTRDNQFAPAPLTSGLAGTIPANNPYNVFGQDITEWRYRFYEIGPRTDHDVGDVFRFVGGFRGDIPDTSWSWEASTLYSEDDRFERFGGDVSASHLLAAAASTDPATAFNIFGNQANTPAVVQSLALTLTERAVSTWAAWDGLVRGTVFELPGGPLKLAVGGGMHQETADFEPDAAYQSGDSATGNSATPIHGRRKVGDVYAEAVIPIFGKDLSFPGMHKLEFSAAGRYDNYSDFGDTENPKISFRYQPLEDESITIRGSYGTSFQAPPLGDLSGSVLSFLGLDVPIHAPNGFTYGNPGPQDQLDNGDNLLGNPKLQPQTSDNYTIGVVLTPPQVKNLSVNVDYYNIQIKGLVIQDPQFIINTFSPGQIDPLTGQPYIRVDNAGNVVGLDVPFLNLGGLNTDGLDIGATYAIPTDDYGKFTLSAEANYTLTWEQSARPGSPFISHLGQDDTAQLFGALPQWRGNFGVLWEYHDFSFNAVAHYTDSFVDEATGNQVSEVVTCDLQASYLWRKAKTKFSVGVLDVNDEAPPKDYAPGATNGNLYARNLYDIRQRFLYASVDIKF